MALRLFRRVLFRPAALVLAAGMLPVLAAGTATGAAAARANAAGPPGWRLFRTVTIPGQVPSLGAVSATNAGNGWAVGSGGATEAGPLAERWSSGAWRTASLPKTALSALGGLTTVGGGATNMWAFDSQARWLHWNGQHWSVGTLPARVGFGTASIIQSALVFSHTDAWAIGEDSSERPYTAHFDGSTWKYVKMSDGVGPMSASAVSPTDIWGLVDNNLGGSGPPFFIARWNGKAWRNAPAPDDAPFESSLTSIYAHNDHDVWAGGVAPDGRGLAAHWTGTSWHITKLPAVPGSSTDDLQVLTPDGSGGLWALASCDCDSAAWRLWHETGGKWSGPTLPQISGDSVTATDIAWVPGTASVWGAGTRTLGSSNQGMILLDGNVP
jgi:hypothetical protein